MMIQYIEVRLQEWAHWSAVREDSGTGYAMSVLNRMSTSSNVFDTDRPYRSTELMTVSDEQAMEVEAAVQQLSDSQRKVVRVCYLTCLTAEQKLKALGWQHRSSLSRALDLIHCQLLRLLDRRHITDRRAMERNDELDTVPPRRVR